MPLRICNFATAGALLGFVEKWIGLFTWSFSGDCHLIAFTAGGGGRAKRDSDIHSFDKHRSPQRLSARQVSNAGTLTLEEGHIGRDPQYGPAFFGQPNGQTARPAELTAVDECASMARPGGPGSKAQSRRHLLRLTASTKPQPRNQVSIHLAVHAHHSTHH